VKKPPARLARVTYYNINSRRRVTVIPVDRRGRVRAEATRRIALLLRDRKARRQRRPHPRLVRMLALVGAHYAPRRIEIVSGYRAPSSRKSKSPHAKALACDFRVAGVSNAQLRDHLRRTFKKIGVGYYPNSVFVHLDVRRKRSAFWVDYSGPGEPAEYSKDPYGDLDDGVADREPVGLPSEPVATPTKAQGDRPAAAARTAASAPAPPAAGAASSGSTASTTATGSSAGSAPARVGAQ
jgi:uncharacterized protein YcbK (DUF882 family)